MNSFIKACEVWTPCPDGSMLEFADGLFGDATAFAELSRAMCFGRGEGLPGRAWDEGRPIVLRPLAASTFRRTAAARDAGIHCAVALPVFLQDELSAVLVLFCGKADDGVGAVELWHNDPRVSTDMRLLDGHFGAGGAALEEISRDVFLPRGTGLAGLAWQRGAAVLIDDLGQSERFLRKDSTTAIGIKRGLSIPCSSRDGHNYVLNLLSASETPIAERLECWTVDTRGTDLQRQFGFSESDGALPAGTDGPTLPLDDSAVGLAYRTGIPRVVDGAAGNAPSQLLIPVVNAEGAVGEVVLLQF